MPTYIKDLIYVLVLGGLAFLTVSRQLVPAAGRQSIQRWMIVWTIATACTFLVRDFWFLLIVSGIFLFIASRFEQDRIVLYLLTFCLAPVVTFTVPGFGGIRNFATLSFQDFLAIQLLVPAFLARERISNQHGKIPVTLLVIYFLLDTLLTLRQTTVTDTLRVSLNYLFAMLVPYLAFAYSVTTPERMKRLILAVIFTSLPLAFIGVFESIKGWHVYESAFQSLETIDYTQRSGLLRAGGPILDPIPFGLFFMVCIGLCLSLSNEFLSLKSRVVVISLLVLGLGSTLSRGPWLGTIAVIFVFLFTGPKPIKNILRFMALGTICVLLVYPFSIGHTIIDLLPYVGSDVNTGTVDYRVKLLNNAWIVINRSPLFGSIDYFNTPEMQELIQGQQIIDVVNTYLGIALQTGLVGLTLFSLFFLASLVGLAKAIFSLPETEFELKLTGRALFATLVGTLVTIFTVSSVSIIPYVYWILAGLCVAQTRIIRSHQSASRQNERTKKLLTPIHTRSARPL